MATPLAVDTTVFGIVIFVVVIVASLVGVIAMVGNRGLYDHIGKGGLFTDDDARMQPAPTPATSAAEADEEIRQMLQARSERLERQGKPALDVEAELDRLKQPALAAFDPGLAEEVRQLVIARNERRERQGKAPLDVDAEV